MTSQDILNIAYAIGGAGLLLLFAVGLVNGLRWLIMRVKNPTVEAVLKALLPLAGQAVFAAENRALTILEETEVRISALDQKAIADAYYALIPETVDIGGRTISLTLVKVIITQERWEEFVQHLFDETIAQINANEKWLELQIQTPVPLESKLPPI